MSRRRRWSGCEGRASAPRRLGATGGDLAAIGALGTYVAVLGAALAAPAHHLVSFASAPERAILSAQGLPRGGNGAGSQLSWHGRHRDVGGPWVPRAPRRAAEGITAMLDVKRLAWLRHSVLAMGPSGQIYYLLAFVLSQLTLLVPVTPFMIAAAYIWGEPWSYVLVSLGVIGSAAVGFSLSRWVARPQVRRMFARRPEARRISSAVGEQGFRIALLCRLSLVLPTAPMTFILGALTDIRFLDFFGATLLGSVPEACATVYLASTVKGTLQHGKFPWYIYVAAAAAVLTLIGTIARISKRALDKSISS